MIHRYGIDTSILVRLTSGDPPGAFRRCVEQLAEILAAGDAEIFVSNQVIGESYIALQHHYGVPKAEARQALRDTLSSGLVAPLDARAVLEALQEQAGCGLLDRLIGQDYRQRGLVTLTLDKRMASLADARLL